MASSWGNSWLGSWATSWDGVKAPRTRSGGAVITDLPKKRGRKPKKASEVIEPAAEQSRTISEEEAAGMAAIYGIPEKQPAADHQESGALAEIEPPEALEIFQIPESVYGSEPVQAPEEAAEAVEEEDDIALILAIIEAIG